MLDQIIWPRDLKKLGVEQLPQVADELRQETINIVSKTGGHLGAGLGVIELTVALHYVFDTPNDLLVWDIGHQAYPHKILTGRRNRMHTLRSANGLSGFLKRQESKYDTFGAGHSSTSISAALGMAVGRDLKGESKNIIAIIGDGALTAGMAYEAMNNAAHLKSRLIVILNDNDMSIAPNVGAMSKYLNRLMSSKSFLNIRQKAKNILNIMPDSIENFAKKTKQYAKDIISGGNFFEELGFHYVGPLDGHDVQTLAYVLKNLKDDNGINSPILIHLKTIKGKGFDSPVDCQENFHAVSKFDADTKLQQTTTASKPTYTAIFGQTLAKMADIDGSIVAITAAMPSGTGINIFKQRHPDKTFDVGIAEQHAVTFAAGLATQGIKPYVAIYSTFLQRAYDQVIHDVVIQNLPVRFMLDRAGLVGADGPTHAGSFDLAYLCCLPNIVVMAPSNEAEFVAMMHETLKINDRPSAIRYPRGEVAPAILPIIPIEIGKGYIAREGSSGVAILNLGTRMQEVMKASELLEQSNTHITIADARFAKPIDTELIRKLATNHKVLITIEEGSVGGFGSWVAQFLQEEGLLDAGSLKFRSMCLPDIFIEQDTPYNMYQTVSLNADAIVSKVKELI